MSIGVFTFHLLLFFSLALVEGNLSVTKACSPSASHSPAAQVKVTIVPDFSPLVSQYPETFQR